MKKIYVILFLVFAFFKVQAQEQNVLNKQERRERNRSFTPYHDIRVGYTFESPLFYGVDSEPYINGGEYGNLSSKKFGTISLAYSFSCFRWLELGASCNYAKYSSFEKNVVISRSNYISLTPTARFVWLNRRNVRLYSSISSGILLSFDKEKEDDGKYSKNTLLRNAFQTTLFGISVGRKVFGHAEVLTFGTNGFFSFGVGVRFNQKSK